MDCGFEENEANLCLALDAVEFDLSAAQERQSRLDGTCRGRVDLGIIRTFYLSLMAWMNQSLDLLVLLLTESLLGKLSSLNHCYSQYPSSSYFQHQRTFVSQYSIYRSSICTCLILPLDLHPCLLFPYILYTTAFNISSSSHSIVTTPRTPRPGYNKDFKD